MNLKWIENRIALVYLFTAVLFILVAANKIFGGYPITGDDVWGATAVLGTPFDVIIFTLRWDLHPPLYYSFLDIWSLLGKSDLWIQSSSAFTHAAVTTLTFKIVLKREGKLAAIISTLLVFSSPLLLQYSTHIRMYSFVSLISLGIFYFIDNYISTGDKKYLKWVFILGVILSNSHAIGIVFVFFHFCYGALHIYSNRSKLISWMFLHAVIGLLAVPAIINSVLKSVDHAAEPTLSSVIHIFKSLFISGPMILVVVSMLLITLLMVEKSSRRIVVCYLFLPVLLFSLISYSLKPMWLERNFIFSLPILYIALGVSISRLKISSILKLIIPIAILCLNISNWKLIGIDKIKNNAFEEVVRLLNNKISSTDNKVCIISQGTLNTFWSLQRYLNGTEWGNPIDVQPPLNERWGQIKEKLPDSLIKALALNPHPNYTESKNLILSSGETNRCGAEDVKMTLTVAGSNYKESSTLILKNSGYSVYQK